MAQRAHAGFGPARRARRLHEPHHTVLQRQQAFGYTFEDLRIIMAPMARDGVEAVGSMGTTRRWPCCPSKPQLLYNYFKQLFAQVTNPPIDCIREELVTSAETTIGSERNLLKPKPDELQSHRAETPILTNEEFAKLKHQAGRVQIGDAADPLQGGRGRGGAGKAMDDLCAQASRAVEAGANIIILVRSRRGCGLAPIPRCWRWRACIII
jgi:glutamate synthase (ferredoxin)